MKFYKNYVFPILQKASIKSHLMFPVLRQGKPADARPPQQAAQAKPLEQLVQALVGQAAAAPAAAANPALDLAIRGGDKKGRDPQKGSIGIYRKI